MTKTSIKGAPDILINRCRYIVNENGTPTTLDESSLERLRDIQNEWCMLGQRVLLICKKTMKRADFNLPANQFEAQVNEIKDFCVLGMVGIIDKPRDGIESVIKTCRKAGIRIFMVTGDFYITAAAIASQIGIFSSSDKYDTLENIKRHRLTSRHSLDAADVTLELNAPKTR